MMKNTPTEDKSAVPSSTNFPKPDSSSMKGGGYAMRCRSVMNCTSVPLSRCNFLAKIPTQKALASCRIVTSTHRCFAQVMLGRLLALCHLVLLAPSIVAQGNAEISKDNTSGYQFQCASVLDLHPIFDDVTDDLKELNPAIDTQIERALTVSLQGYLNTKTDGVETLGRSDDSQLILEPVGCDEQGSNNPVEWKCEKVVDLSHIDGPIDYACRSIYGENTSLSCLVYPYPNYIPSYCGHELLMGANVFYSSSVPTNEPSLPFPQNTRGPKYIYILVNYHSGAFKFGGFPTIKNRNVMPEWKCVRSTEPDQSTGGIVYNCWSLYGEKAAVKVYRPNRRAETTETTTTNKFRADILFFTYEFEHKVTKKKPYPKKREDRNEAENTESEEAKPQNKSLNEK